MKIKILVLSLVLGFAAMSCGNNPNNAGNENNNVPMSDSSKTSTPNLQQQDTTQAR